MRSVNNAQYSIYFSYPTFTILNRKGMPGILLLNSPGVSSAHFSTQVTGRAGTAMEHVNFPAPFMSNESGTGYDTIRINSNKPNHGDKKWTYLVPKASYAHIPVEHIRRTSMIPVPNQKQHFFLISIFSEVAVLVRRLVDY